MSSSTLENVLNDAERLLKLQRRHQQRPKKADGGKAKGKMNGVAAFVRKPSNIVTFQTSEVFARLANECRFVPTESCQERFGRLEQLLGVARSPLLSPLFVHYSKALKSMCTTFLWQFLNGFGLDDNAASESSSSSSAAQAFGDAYCEEKNLANYLAASWQGNSDLVQSNMGEFAAAIAEHYVQVASVYVAAASTAKDAAEQAVAADDSCFSCCVGDVRRVFDDNMSNKNSSSSKGSHKGAGGEGKGVGGSSGQHTIHMLSAHLLTLYYFRHVAVHQWLAAGALLSSATHSSHRHLHEHVARFLIRVWLWLMLTDNTLSEQWHDAACKLASKAETYGELLLLFRMTCGPILAWSHHVSDCCCLDNGADDVSMSARRAVHDTHIIMCRQFIAPLTAASTVLCVWLDEFRVAFSAVSDECVGDYADQIASLQTNLRRATLDCALIVTRMSSEGVGLRSAYASMDRMSFSQQQQPLPSPSSTPQQQTSSSATMYESLTFSATHACFNLANSFLTVSTPFAPMSDPSMTAFTYGVILQRASAILCSSMHIASKEYDDWTRLASFCMHVAALAAVDVNGTHPSQSDELDDVTMRKRTEPVVSATTSRKRVDSASSSSNESITVEKTSEQRHLDHLQRVFVYNVGKNIAKSLILHTASKLVAADQICLRN